MWAQIVPHQTHIVNTFTSDHSLPPSMIHTSFTPPSSLVIYSITADQLNHCSQCYKDAAVLNQGDSTASNNCEVDAAASSQAALPNLRVKHRDLIFNNGEVEYRRIVLKFYRIESNRCGRISSNNVEYCRIAAGLSQLTVESLSKKCRI
jgi:hypothetical protein